MMTSIAESDNVAYFGSDVAVIGGMQKGTGVDAASS
jgi:hypothetical protein